MCRAPPIDGVVITRHVHAGETVDAGAPILTIADLRRTRVEAEIDEYDTARMRHGASVEVTAEGFDQKWRGTISAWKCGWATGRQGRERLWFAASYLWSGGLQPAELSIVRRAKSPPLHRNAFQREPGGRSGRRSTG